MSVHSDKELDTTNVERGVWLVKVPKYVATKWEKASGNIEVGKLKICKQPGQKMQVELSLSEAVLNLKEPGEENIPKDHRLDVLPVKHLTLGVFSHTAPSNLEGVIPESEKLAMEGRIVQKLECRPYADNTYMKLKLETIRKASLPVRQVKQLDRARDDKEAVLNMLFAAFEKHQYYNIRDLVKITNQPIVYLKEILNEVCNYNIKNPHKNMWELKPEYRHYKESDETNQ
ncbi:conserved hypothetical protein [Pediculus humanus corporis]|uniref:General transcription factor IIF subunit 2 n=1 Tax=Pediculus humanus subsp. corporis TaxID=121224 RepID=E0VC41_PEDHC|nr:uncharacterized protein Phum_PHUM079820 [Pediculus humanus corporis]EEB10947.1 conserved hypothetical protein [Pediculus humanus corporis]